MLRMDSPAAAQPPSARAGFQEPSQLVHLLVEEREHGNRAVAALFQILIHQVEIRVAREEPHLDVGAALDELDHERYMRQAGAAQSSLRTSTRRVPGSRSRIFASSGRIVTSSSASTNRARLTDM